MSMRRTLGGVWLTVCVVTATLHAGQAARTTVNALDAQGATPLLWAAHNGDRAEVTRLLQAGADPKIANRYGVTPLHEAALRADVAIVLALLKAGAPVNATFGAGETPLMTAARSGNVEVVRALIAAGANVNAKEQGEGQTALMWAAAENHAAVVSTLLEAGADVNARSVDHAYQKVLVKPGNTIMERPLGYLTPLHFAARQGAVEAADALIRGGADLSAVDPTHKFTPLLTAVYNGNYDTAALLVDRGANLNDGSLYLLVEMRNLDKFTNRPNPPDKDRTLTALDVIGKMIARGVDVNQGFYKTVPQIQTQGTVRPISGGTALYRAIRSIDLDAARLLLRGGADPSQAADDGTTPLMVLASTQPPRAAEEEVVDAGRRGEPLDAMRLLLDAGADVNAMDENGNTALHLAAAQRANPMIELLASRGAIVDVKNYQDRTPVDVALGAPLTPTAGGRAGGAGRGGPSPAAQATAALLRRLATKTP